jgi:hypothetical protein
MNAAKHEGHELLSILRICWGAGSRCKLNARSLAGEVQSSAERVDIIKAWCVVTSWTSKPRIGPRGS